MDVCYIYSFPFTVGSVLKNICFRVYPFDFVSKCFETMTGYRIWCWEQVRIEVGYIIAILPHLSVS